MTLRGPPLDQEPRLPGIAFLLDPNRAGGLNHVLERPAGDGLPAVIRIVDSDEEDLPIYISSDEEEAGEYEVGMVGMVGMVGEGLGFPPLPSDEEDEPEEDGHQVVESDEEQDEDDEDSEDSEDSEDDWFLESEDSGYDSMSEDEEASEDDASDDDGIRPDSPLVQDFPPEDFWQGWRPSLLPIAGSPPIAPAAVPQQLTIRQPLEPCEVSQRWEECAPSTSGLSSSAKRSREDDEAEEVSTKRPRWNCEEQPESVPSTSGQGPSINRRVWFRPFVNETWDDDSDSD